jgi:hypothetical protein
LPTTARLGNDLVDLTTPHTAGKARDLRFLRRVFTAAEQDRIASSPDPDRVLWKLWSAKEAAYKAWSRYLPDLVFAHSRFEVDPEDGSVRLPQGLCRVHWCEQEEWIHCLAWTGFPEGLSWKVEGLPKGVPENGPEAITIPSLQARDLAARLLAGIGLPGARLHREDRRPPVVLLEGRLLEGFLVSWSHDGNRVAAAVARTGRGQEIPL